MYHTPRIRHCDDRILGNFWEARQPRSHCGTFIDSIEETFGNLAGAGLEFGAKGMLGSILRGIASGEL